MQRRLAWKRLKLGQGQQGDGRRHKTRVDLKEAADQPVVNKKAKIELVAPPSVGKRRVGDDGDEHPREQVEGGPCSDSGIARGWQVKPVE